MFEAAPSSHSTKKTFHGWAQNVNCQTTRVFDRVQHGVFVRCSAHCFCCEDEYVLLSDLIAITNLLELQQSFGDFFNCGIRELERLGPWRV